MANEIILPHKCDFKPNGPDPENATCRICGKGILQDVVIPEPAPEKPLEFIKYRKILNVEDGIVDTIKEQLLDDGPWVAVNKYHGTNFSVWCSADKFFFAQRSGKFTIKDNPYKFFEVEARPKYVERIAKEIQLHFGKNIALFFELFGGSYPHPEVNQLSNSKHPRIQKGVFYCPHIDIRLIDIVVDGRYLDYNEFKTVADTHNIKRAAEIYRGTFEECIKTNNVFEDPTHKDYKLPRIEENFSEGLVIRPCKEKTFKNGKRVILKSKNPLFKEKQREPRKERVKVPDEDVQKVVDELSKSVTQNRLENILSHGHTIKESNDYVKIVGLMVQDILKENESFVGKIDEDLLKAAKKALHNEVAEFIRPTILPIIREAQFNEQI